MVANVELSEQKEYDPESKTLSCQPQKKKTLQERKEPF